MIEAKSHLFEVSLAYAGTLALLALLIAVTLLQARRARQDLDRIEKTDG